MPIQAETTIWLKSFITILCGVGLYASVFMLAKTRRAERGLLEGPSVVQSPRARLFGGLPNALLGNAYYPLVVLLVWVRPLPLALDLAIAAAALAAVTSAFLAYSLLFVTRRACPYCWSAHAANWLLLAALLALRCSA